MKPEGLKVVDNPDVAKLFSDPLRREILHLLTHKEMSAADLVKEIGKNYSSIVYHLRLLEEAEFEFGETDTEEFYLEEENH